MAFTPEPAGSISAPNTVTPESAGEVAAPVTVAPESAGAVATPVTVTPETAGEVAVPVVVAPEAAVDIAVPITVTPESSGSVAVPTVLTDVTEGAIATPVSLSPETLGEVAAPVVVAPEAAGAVAIPATVTPESAGEVAAPTVLDATCPVTVPVAGTLLEPDVIASMYEESDGQTPVTASSDPVGLLLDGRYKLERGAELVTNGDFATDSDWTKGGDTTIGGGSAIADNESGTIVEQAISLADDKFYEVAFDVTLSAGTGIAKWGTTDDLLAFSATGRYSVIVLHDTGAADTIRIFGTAFTGTVDNVSVKLVDGNHALQATDASRPSYTTTEITGVPAITGDGVADCLTGQLASANYQSTGLTIFGIAQHATAAGSTDEHILSVGNSASSVEWFSIRFGLGAGKVFAAIRNTVGSAASLETISIDTEPFTFIVWFDGSGNLVARINGVEYATTFTVNQIILDQFGCLCLHRSTTSNFADASLGTHGIILELLTDAEILTLEAKLEALI